MTAVAPSTSSPPVSRPQRHPAQWRGATMADRDLLANLVAQTAIILTGGLVGIDRLGPGLPHLAAVH